MFSVFSAQLNVLTFLSLINMHILQMWLLGWKMLEYSFNVNVGVLHILVIS